MIAVTQGTRNTWAFGIFNFTRDIDAGFLSPVGTDFLPAQPKLFPVRATYLSISAREKRGILFSEIPIHSLGN